MGLFNKKEDVPEIPKASGLPELPTAPKKEEKKELPELPSFPSSSASDNLNQEMVKSAVSDSSSPEEKDSDGGIPEAPATLKKEFPAEGSTPSPPRLEFPTPSIPPKQVINPEPISEAPEPRPVFQEPPREEPRLIQATAPTTSTVEPIFVRIDKFQQSQKNFGDIKGMILQMENVIGKIKEVKEKEESEIKGWSEDVEKIKTKLAQIDSDIFSQI
jgi:hypothetical protein